MLYQAARDYNIDLAQSYMIGDGENDVKAGLAAGCKSILIGREQVEDFGQMDTVESLLQFAERYL